MLDMTQFCQTSKELLSRFEVVYLISSWVCHVTTAIITTVDLETGNKTAVLGEALAAFR